ncbi:MAG: NEW3 domain-containing protein [Gemmatimonadaceae bacterium]
MRRPALFALIALVMAGAIPSAAQRVSVAARDTATTVALPGATVSLALRVTNGGAERVALKPNVAVPTDWSAPIGAMPFALAAGETDSWIVSIRIPTRAPAGRYVIALTAADSAGTERLSDSLVVEVSARRGLELSLMNRPTYSVSGDAFRSNFLLQNRGNVPTTVSMRGTAGLGGIVTLDSTRVSLGAGEEKTIGVSVATRLKDQEARDEVVELFAMDMGDTSVTAFASSRVTIVQEANSSEPLHRVASQLRLRAADRSAGVSPFELIGSGLLRDGGTEQLSFVMRGSAGRFSQFGDQDEYKIEVQGAHYTARLGDALYKASDLTNSGQAGFGGGLEVRQGAFSAGAFAQKFRFQFDGPSERGAFVKARADSVYGAPVVTVSGLSRTGGVYAGSVVSSGISMEPVAGAILELEVAGSNGQLGRGLARTARISGGDQFRYDLGHVDGDNQFAGVTRGQQHDYFSLAYRPITDVQLTATTGAHRSSGVTLGFLAPQRYVSSTLEAAYKTQYSLQFSDVTRQSSVLALHVDEYQRGFLAKSEQNIGTARIWGGAGSGLASDGAGERHVYHELQVGASATSGGNSFSVYGETSKGMSITRGASHLLTYGGDTRLRLLPATYLTLAGFSSSVLDGGDRYAQADATLSQYLSTGATISLRVRVSSLNDGNGRNVAFAEYSTPLQLPTGRARSVGRVRGRVVDQETGQGVSGTLVRLGPQAAITDDEGRVAFAGLPAGQYRLSIAQQRAQTPTVFTGDATVVIDSTRRVPTTFALAVQRAGIVEGSVRQMAVARTSLQTAPDSLADAGPLSAITLALIGVRDTVYASTDANGAFRFNEVSGGSWVLKVASEAPLGLRWEPAEIEVSVEPGATRTIEFRQVPRRRAVQMIGGDVIVVPPKLQKK